MDEQSRWWAAVVAVAVHWLSATDDEIMENGGDSGIERFYQIVDTLPKTLANAE